MAGDEGDSRSQGALSVVTRNVGHGKSLEGLPGSSGGGRKG